MPVPSLPCIPLPASTPTLLMSAAIQVSAEVLWPSQCTLSSHQTTGYEFCAVSNGKITKPRMSLPIKSDQCGS